MFLSFDTNASDLMAVPDIFELRGQLTAFGNSLVTARMESAAGGRVQRAGDFPFEKYVLSIFVDEWIGDRYSRQQSPGVRVERGSIQGIRIRDLDNMP